MKYAQDFIFDHFLHFFLFDSLGAVPENPGTDIRGVRLSVGLIYRGTTVLLCTTYVLLLATTVLCTTNNNVITNAINTTNTNTNTSTTSSSSTTTNSITNTYYSWIGAPVDVHEK